MANRPENPSQGGWEAFSRLENAVGIVFTGVAIAKRIDFSNGYQLGALPLNGNEGREIAVKISENECPCLSFVIKGDGIKSLCVFCELNPLVNEDIFLIGDEIPSGLGDILVIWIEESVKKGELELSEPVLENFILPLVVNNRASKIS